MPAATIQYANKLFQEKRYDEALAIYIRCQKTMPGLARILDTSIRLCRNRIEHKNSTTNEVVEINDDPIIVRFFPDYSSTNPYQRLLYSDQLDEFVIRPGDLQQVMQDLLTRKYRRTIFHLHWVTHVLAGATSHDDADQRVTDFLNSLEQFIDQGGELVWTIHNSIEHDCKFLKAERRLREGICRAARRIHIHSELGIPEIEKHYLLPRSKTVVIPHGNYLGYYRDFVTRDAARKFLGIGEDEIVFLCLGMIRPYKGLEKLLKAFSLVHAKQANTRLIVAGKVVHPYKSEQIRSLADAYAGVTVITEEIPDSELQYYFRAADATVLAYRSILTSGSVYLALSFDNPVIGPDVPAFREIIQNGANGLLYSPDGGSETLARSLLQFCLKSPVERTKMREFAASEIKKHSWVGAVQSLFGNAVVSRHLSSRFKRFNIDLQSVICDVYEPAHIALNASIGIIVLNYESTEDVAELIASIEAINRKDLLPVIVDNYSPSETVEKLRRRFPNCVVIRTPSNLGYAGGNNVGIRYLQELGVPYTWILNPDTVVEAATLDTLLVGAAEDPTTHIWGSLITYYDRPKTIWFGGGYISFETQCSIGHMYHEKPVDVAPAQPYKVDYVTGASIFCRTEVFSVAGLIPEHYFLYFEETDWCLRASHRGLRISVNPKSILLHKKRSQVGQMPTKYYMYYFVRGAMLFRLRFSGSSEEQARQEVMESFVKPWLNRIAKASPADHAFFEQLALRAIDDGSHGRSGPVDLKRVLGSAQWLGKSPSEIITGDFAVDDDNRIVGFVKNLAQPAERIMATVWIDDRPVGKVSSIADPQSPSSTTLAHQGTNFEFLIPQEYVDGGTHQVKVLAEEVELACASSNILLQRSVPKYIGRIDGLQDRSLKGWCVDSANPQITFILEIVCSGRVIAVCPNDLVRPDLAKAGIKAKYGGFSVPIPIEFCDGKEHTFSMRVIDGKSPIHSRKLRMDLKKYPMAPKNADYSTLAKWMFTRREISFTHPENRLLPAVRNIELKTEILIEQAKDSAQSNLVSVIMPVFNRESVVLSAISSCVAQSYKNWELLICDDGSSDQSVEVIRSYVKERNLESRIKIYTLTKNLGVSAARNFALQKATGTIIAYLDSDNSWDTDYLLVMVHRLNKDSRIGCAYCGDRIVQHYPAINDMPAQSEVVALRFGPYNKTLLENKNYIDLNVFVHHKKLYDELGGFSEEMTRLVDWELILRYSKRTSIHFVPAILATYNYDFCTNQITRLHDYSQNALRLKMTLERLRKRSFSELLNSDSDTTETLILLVNKGLELPPNFELIRGAWENSSANSKVAVVVLNSVQDCDTLASNKESNNLHPVFENQTDNLFSIFGEFENIKEGACMNVVVTTTTAVPSYGWDLKCRAIAQTDMKISAITATRYVSAAVARRNEELIFQNSRNDFDFDLATLSIEPVFDRIEPDEFELLEIIRPSPFFTYFPMREKLSLQKTLCQMSEVSSRLEDLLKLGGEGKVIYCPDIVIRDCIA